jgi:hypothetical protein
MESNIGWSEIFIIMIVIYIMFPCWIYIIFKMATMGIFEGLLNINNKIKGEMKHGKKQKT